MHNPAIMAVAFQKFFTEPKKILRWKTVIFQNYSFFLMFKKPTECSGWPHATAQILFPEKSFQLTVPIHTVNDFPCFPTIKNIAIHANARSISGNIQARWFSFSDGFKNNFGGVRSIKNDHKNSGMQGWMRRKWHDSWFEYQRSSLCTPLSMTSITAFWRKWSSVAFVFMQIWRMCGLASVCELLVIAILDSELSWVIILQFFHIKFSITNVTFIQPP